MAANLPAATGSGNSFIWKKIDSTANGCALNVAASPGADLIDGQASLTISVQYGSIQVQDVVAGIWDIQ